MHTASEKDTVCGIIVRAMTSLAEQFHRGRRAQPAAITVTAPDGRDAGDPAISPQDFYQELVERPDVRRILTRLAQVEDGGA